MSVADQPEVTAPKVQVLRELELVTVTPAIRAERERAVARRARSSSTSAIASPNDLGIQRGDVIVQINSTRIRIGAKTRRRRSTTTAAEVPSACSSSATDRST